MIRSSQQSQAAVSAGLVLLLSVTVAQAAVTNRTWDGSTNSSWEEETNWSDDNMPNSGGINGENAVIGDTAVDRNITTSTPLSFVQIVNWTQSSDAVNKITLGDDMANASNVSGVAPSTVVWDNSSSSAANMVLDLNGHTYLRGTTFGANFTAGTGGMTLLSTVAGGVFQQKNFGQMSDAIVVGDGVTLKSTGAAANGLKGTWSDTATFWAASNTTGATTATTSTVTTFSADGTGSIGNMTIGDADASFSTYVAMLGGQTGPGQIRGNVAINSFVGATGGAASTLVFASTYDNAAVTANLYVGGNWTDAGSDATGYAGAAKLLDDDGVGPNPSQWYRRTITFIGDPGSARTVSIGRTALVNDFAVGSADLTYNAGTPTEPDYRTVTGTTGHVVLGQDLTTTGQFIVREGSTLDVALMTLTASRVIIEDGAIIALTDDGAVDSGLIAASGTNADGGIGELLLNGLTLNVVNGANWTSDEHDLVLFTYAGSLIGTPVLTLGDVPMGFSYDELLTDGGSVRLTNVTAVPEPATIGLLLLGVGLMRPRRGPFSKVMMTRG